MENLELFIYAKGYQANSINKKYIPNEIVKTINKDETI